MNISLFQDAAGRPVGRRKLEDILSLTGPRAAENVNRNFDRAFKNLVDIADALNAYRINVDDIDTSNAPSATTFLRGDGSWAQGGAVLLAKTVDQSVTNNSTLQDDTVLKFTASAGRYYYVEGALLLTATDATTDWKIFWNLPGASVLGWGPEWIAGVTPNWNPVGTGSSPAVLSTTQIVAGSAATLHGFNFLGVILGGAADSTVTLQWAQNSAGAAKVNTVKAGSILRYHLAN